MFRSARDMVRVRTPIKEAAVQHEEVYSCDLCPADGWHSETEVEIHKHTIHKEQLNQVIFEDYVCGICCKQFNDVPELLKHIKTEHLFSSEDAYRVERELFICDVCCQIFFNKQHLIAHIVRKHTENRKILIQCPHCEIYRDGHQLWLHQQNHMLQSISSCRICFTKCVNRKDLRRHINKHPTYNKCDICDIKFKNLSLFNKHIRDCHKKCNGASKVRNVNDCFIPRRYDLCVKSQMLTVYRGLMITNNIKICILCREICLGVDAMQNHIQNDHHDKDLVKNEYTCSCGEIFDNKVLLKHHIFKMKGDHCALGGNYHIRT